jgi:hypothetical protein
MPAAGEAYIEEEFAQEEPSDTPDWMLLDEVDVRAKHVPRYTLLPEGFQA